LVFTDTSAGGNTLRALTGVDNRIVGATGDTIYGADHNDTITAGKNSTVFAGSGTDTITVGQNNTVYAGQGADTVIVNAGSGQVILNENYTYKSTSQNQDVVKLGTGISASATQISRSLTNDLILNFGNGDALTIVGYFVNASKQPTIMFADGTTWSYTSITSNLVFTDTSAGSNTLHALTGVDNRIVGATGDTLYGADHNDTITAGKNSTVFAGSGTDTITVGQNNTVYAGQGADTVIVNVGSGQVILNENYTYKSTSQNQDVVKLGTGISASATQISRSLTNDLLLNFGNGDSLTIVGYFVNASKQPTIMFADGTTWSYTSITSNLVFTDTSAGGNTLHALTGVDNRIVSATGDTIFGADHNDTITAGKNNTVFAGSGTDTITVGQNNTVYAGQGADTVIVNVGSGQVILNENYTYKSTSQNQDVVKLGTGISASATQISRSLTNDLILNFGNGDALTIVGYFVNASKQPAITFADGTTWSYTTIMSNLVFTDTSAGGNTLHALAGVDNRIVGATGDTIFGADHNDTITAGKNNTLYAGAGIDRFETSVGCGAVTINEAAKTAGSNQDTLLVNGVDPSRLWFNMSGNNLVVDIMGTTDQITIDNWASSSANQLQTIEVDNGAKGKSLLSADAVSQLVQAMASFSAGHAGFDPTSASTSTITDPNVLLAVNSNWHH
ncbi:beta strand repeat-containing protein, partial [Trinickia fusca]